MTRALPPILPPLKATSSAYVCCKELEALNVSVYRTKRGELLCTSLLRVGLRKLYLRLRTLALTPECMTSGAIPRHIWLHKMVISMRSRSCSKWARWTRRISMGELQDISQRGEISPKYLLSLD